MWLHAVANGLRKAIQRRKIDDGAHVGKPLSAALSVCSAGPKSPLGTVAGTDASHKSVTDRDIAGWQCRWRGLSRCVDLTDFEKVRTVADEHTDTADVLPDTD